MVDPEFEPGRWYRINNPDTGKLWMETSDPYEAFTESVKRGWPVQRLWVRMVTTYDWRPAEPPEGWAPPNA